MSRACTPASLCARCKNRASCPFARSPSDGRLKQRAKFAHEQALPEPLLPRPRIFQGHSFQVRPQVLRRAERQKSSRGASQTRPQARGLILEARQGFLEHDFFTGKIGAERKFRKQSARARNEESLFERTRRVVPVHGRYRVFARQLSGGLSLAFEA